MDNSGRHLEQTLREDNLDALVCASPVNVLLLTGFWPIMANSVAILTARGNLEVIVPADEEEEARASTSAKLTSFQPASLSDLVDPTQALGTAVVERLRSLGLEHSRIGCEMEAFMQPASYLSMNLQHGELRRLWQESLPGITVRNADALLSTARASKIVPELKDLRLGCEIAGTAYQRSRAAIHAGATEHSIAGALLHAYQTALEDSAVRREQAYFFCMSGPNASVADAAYARTRHRTIKSGDMVMVHCNSATNGMWTDISRTFSAEEETAEYKKVKSTVANAINAALEAIRPGALGKDIDHAAREIMEQAGYGPYFTHATGHGVGFAGSNPNGLPRIHPRSEDRLEEGMVFNIEPAAYLKGQWGYRHCDLVAVTGNASALLTSF